MDPIDDVLDTMNIEKSRYFRFETRAPWGIAFHPRNAAHLMMITAGSCWLSASPLDPPLKLTSGECILIQADVDFTLQHDFDSEIVSCDEVVTDIAVTFGGDGDMTEIHFGRFPVDTVAAEPLLTRLPPVVALDLDGPSCQALRGTLDLLAQETLIGGVGSRLITSRLADVLFMQALRASCSAAADDAASWLTALRYPDLARAMHAMHADLGRAWTVDTLAREAHMSRSAFAAAFKAKTGDTPLAYLTSWRIYRTKALLRDTTWSIHEIAAKVGYDTGTALSRTFTRHEGITPSAWRRQHLNT